jgi:hypothetical protein
VAKERCATRPRSATRSALAARSDLPERGRSTRRNSRIARGYSSVMEACDRCFFPNGRSARTTLSHRRQRSLHARTHAQSRVTVLRQSPETIASTDPLGNGSAQQSHTNQSQADPACICRCRACAAVRCDAPQLPQVRSIPTHGRHTMCTRWYSRCVPAGTPDVYPLALPMIAAR